LLIIIIIGSMLATSRTSRVRGCDPPFSVEQISVFILEIFFTSLTLAVISLYAERPGPLAICLILYLLCFLTVLISYVYCSGVDPAAPNIDYLFLPTRKSTTSRYCRICSKSIPGLDHHCVWLNTCIGARTYWAFYILASAGLLQHILQFILCILVATPLAWKLKRTEGSVGDDNGPIFAGIVSALSIIGIVAFGSLWLFHSYLLTQGIGTYDWLLRRAERRARREEEEERKEDERIRHELARASGRMLEAAETISKMESELDDRNRGGVDSSLREGTSVVVGIENGGIDGSSNGILGPRPTQSHSHRLSTDSDDFDDDNVVDSGSGISGPSPRLNSAAEMRRRERVATLRANVSNNRLSSAHEASVEFEDSDVPTSSTDLTDAKNRLFSTMSTRMSLLRESSENKGEEDGTTIEVKNLDAAPIRDETVQVTVSNDGLQPVEDVSLSPSAGSEYEMSPATVDEEENHNKNENKEEEEEEEKNVD